MLDRPAGDRIDADRDPDLEDSRSTFAQRPLSPDAHHGKNRVRSRVTGGSLPLRSSPIHHLARENGVTIWCARRDSNPQPSDPYTTHLPSLTVTVREAHLCTVSWDAPRSHLATTHHHVPGLSTVSGRLVLTEVHTMATTSWSRPLVDSRTCLLQPCDTATGRSQAHIHSHAPPSSTTARNTGPTSTTNTIARLALASNT